MYAVIHIYLHREKHNKMLKLINLDKLYVEAIYSSLCL